jgi:hypothetical protein
LDQGFASEPQPFMWDTPSRTAPHSG